MSKSNVWVTGNRSEGYRVVSAGASRAASLHTRQSDAIHAANAIAERRGVEVIVQNTTNGQIREKNSHGPDSPKVPG